MNMVTAGWLLIIVPGSAALLPAQNLRLSGYVDGSIQVPTDSSTNLGFSFDGLEIVLEKTLAAGVTMRADIDFHEGAADVEQAYVTVAGFTFGKFNAPLGFELLDAPDMYQFSHSLLFDYALPTNLSGLSYTLTWTRSVTLLAYVANGWDVNGADDDRIILGGRLGYDGATGLAAGMSAIQHDDGDLVLDFDATYTSIDNLILGAEVNQGGYRDSASTSLGWLAMGNYAWEKYALTLRQDKLGKGATTTVSPSFRIAEGALILLEYTVGKDMTGTAFSLAAVEITYSF